MRRIARITGRSDDMLIIRGVNVFPSQIEELLLKQSDLAPHYQLEISRDGPLDNLTVLVEMQLPLVVTGVSAQALTAKALQHNIKAYIGVSAEVRLLEPGKIERSGGKAKRVIDRRPKSHE